MFRKCISSQNASVISQSAVSVTVLGSTQHVLLSAQLRAVESQTPPDLAHNDNVVRALNGPFLWCV